MSSLIMRAVSALLAIAGIGWALLIVGLIGLWLSGYEPEPRFEAASFRNVPAGSDYDDDHLDELMRAEMREDDFDAVR